MFRFIPLLHLRQRPLAKCQSIPSPLEGCAASASFFIMASTPATLRNDPHDLSARRRHEDPRTFLDSGGGKRRKVQRACDGCKSRKRKCSGEQPCSLCVSQGLVCTYVTPHGRNQVDQAADTFLLDNPRHILAHSAQSQWADEPVSVLRPGRVSSTNETSRAGSPDGEGITPAGYQGPTSTFSVSLVTTSSR